MSKLIKAMISATLLTAGSVASANSSLPVHFFVQGGGYSSSPGKSQNININTLIGDSFSVNHQNQYNTIFGAGFLVDGLRMDRFGIDYGINAFYLAKTKVSGEITQEHSFTNLSYQYYVSHLPVYVFAKGFINTNYDNLSVTADAGIGPNFMNTNLYTDSPLNSYTVPDNAYTGNFSTTVLSGMVGVGLKYNVMGQVPVELGYRYFFLGNGSLHPRTSQIQNNLKTGTINAQALIVTISI